MAMPDVAPGRAQQGSPASVSPMLVEGQPPHKEEPVCPPEAEALTQHLAHRGLVHMRAESTQDGFLH